MMGLQASHWQDKLGWLHTTPVEEVDALRWQDAVRGIPCGSVGTARSTVG